MQRLIVFGILVSAAGFAQSDVSRLRLGPAQKLDKPGSIELLVELPKGATVQPGDFQLVEDGKATVHAAAVKPFRNSGWPLATVLALDSSRSIKKPMMDQVKQAAAGFVAQARDPVAVVTFADQPVAAPFGTARQELVSRISALHPEGHQTRLYQALDAALALFNGRKAPERQRIIVISDGSEESHAEPDSVDTALARARQRRVAIDTIWLATPVAGARNTMVRMSERTGGVHNDARNAAEILAGLRHVLEEVDRSVVVAFDRRIDQKGPLTREVGVTVNRPEIASATMPLQIAATVLEPPGPNVMQIVLWALAILAALYVLYALAYVIVKKYFPERIGLFPIPPWPQKQPQKPEFIPAPPPLPKPQQQGRRPRPATVVAPRNPLMLEAVTGPFEGRRFPVNRPVLRIGADPANELNLDTDDYVSAQHAVIENSNDQWIIADQGSRNGTFINGRKLVRGSDHVLQDGESIRIGRSEFLVILRISAQAAQVPDDYDEPR